MRAASIDRELAYLSLQLLWCKWVKFLSSVSLCIPFILGIYTKKSYTDRWFDPSSIGYLVNVTPSGYQRFDLHSMEMDLARTDIKFKSFLHWQCDRVICKLFCNLAVPYQRYHLSLPRVLSAGVAQPNCSIVLCLNSWLHAVQNTTKNVSFQHNCERSELS